MASPCESVEAVREVSGGRRRLVRRTCRPACGFAGTFRLGEEHHPSDHRRSGDVGRGLGRADRRGRHGRPDSTSRGRVRLSTLRTVSPHDGPREHRLRPEGAEDSRRRRSGSGWTPFWNWCSSQDTPSDIPRSSRVGSASGWRCAGLAPRPKVLLLDEPFGRSTPRSATSCGRGCAGFMTRFT